MSYKKEIEKCNDRKVATHEKIKFSFVILVV